MPKRLSLPLLLLVLHGCLLAACAPLPDTNAVSPAAIHLPVVATPLFVRLEPFAVGVPGVTDLAHTPDGRLFAATRDGLIYEIDSVGRLRDIPLLDIHELVETEYMEQGLLGLAFHPDFAANGHFYVYYSEAVENQVGPAALARYTAMPGGSADLASEVRLLTVPHALPLHYGGALHFGPDGYLYVASGNGTHTPQLPGRSVPTNSQNGDNLLGKILRLDVDGGSFDGRPYAIPPDNPFVGDDGIRDEIWLMGLRNPWRFSIDRETGDLYIADVGGERYEEVNVAPAGVGGLNFGWPCFEGNEPGPERDGCGPAADYAFPLHTFDHTGGHCAITGGYVYRGRDLPSLAGHYLFGDFCNGDLWALWVQDGQSNVALINPDTKRRWSTFGESINGELYLGEVGDATTIFRLRRAD